MPHGRWVLHLMFEPKLFHTPLDQAQIDFENEGGETYICGNPPYLGSKWQSAEQKSDLSSIFDGRVKGWKSLDYVAGWFMKAAEFGKKTRTVAAFVSTNSICQGEQVSLLWPAISKTGTSICFAHTSFKWSNLANHNAGVTVVIVGISDDLSRRKVIFTLDDGKETLSREVGNINAYLVASSNIVVEPRTKPLSDLAVMQFGNHPYYGAALIFSMDEAREMIASDSRVKKFIRPLLGSQEFIKGSPRACLWIKDDDAAEAMVVQAVRERVEKVRRARLAATKDVSAQKLARTPYRFRDAFEASDRVFAIPRVSSESREYLPIGLLDPACVLQDASLALYDAPLWNMALIASRLHLVWIATVCGKLETRYRYSNTLGWNTFPVPTLTEKNKADLTACAEAILLAREAHFPATIADLYDPEKMPENLRAAHDRNDETLERIYIGRRFKNDTERLEKLFEMYTKMTTKVGKVRA
jgi:hypothetical protein